MRRALIGLVASCLGCITWSSEPTPIDLPLLTPEQGFSIRLGPFAVAAGTERQACYFLDIPDIANGQPVYIKRMAAGMNQGSHHMNVFRVKTIVNLDGPPGSVVIGGECWHSSNWADWPLVFNTQQSNPDHPVVDWTLPDGVDEKFMPGEKIMVQSHYTNASTQQTPDMGKVEINFYRSQDPNPIELSTLFATQQNIRICRSNPNPTYFGTCSLPAGDYHIAAANGHFHSRGKEFQMFTWDGTSTVTPPLPERFYDSQVWSDPPMLYGVDVRPPSSGGIWWTCAYAWRQPPPNPDGSDGCTTLDANDPQHANDCCYTFGPNTDFSEHCNAFVYFWPKPPSSAAIFCN